MEINQNSMSLLSLIGGSPLMGPATPGLDFGESQGSALSSFVDLLDVAADLELAENQSLNAEGDLEATLAQNVFDKAKDDIAQQENQSALSGISSALLNGLSQKQNESVGQIQFVRNEKNSGQNGNGIEHSKNLLLESATVDLLGKNQLAGAQTAKAGTLNSEALAQWSAAISANELKSVRLENSLDAVASAKISNLAAKEKAVTIQTLSGVSPGNLSIGIAGLNASNISSEDFSESNSSLLGERREKTTSLEAKELLLERGTAQTFASGLSALTAPSIAPSSKSALLKADTLGEAGDSRISHQSLDFVAEKIEQLKSQGGGSIRIELAPKEMGSIDVKVGMRGGMLQVQIKAEHLVTEQALQASKADLQLRLSKVAPSEVSVSALRDINKEVVKLSRHKSLMQNSENFLGSLNGSQIKGMSGIGVEQSLQASSAGNSTASSSGGRGDAFTSDEFLSQNPSTSSWEKQESFRDDKRDQARDQWEQLSRKSA